MLKPALVPNTRRTHQAVFLDEMNLLLPWTGLLAVMDPSAPRARTGRPPLEWMTLLRIHFVQPCSGLFDPAMDESKLESAMYRDFVGQSSVACTPDRVSILRFRHLLKTQQLALRKLATVNATRTDKSRMLRQAAAIGDTLIAAPSPTNSQNGERDPVRNQTHKGQQWHFGIKAPINADADFGLVHTVVGTVVKVHGVIQAHQLLHIEETDLFVDVGYQGVAKREEAQANLYMGMRSGKRRALNKRRPMGAALEKLEHLKASISAKVKQPFPLIKRPFGFLKIRYQGLTKNTTNLMTLFALSNLCMLRRRLLQSFQACLRLNAKSCA